MRDELQLVFRTRAKEGIILAKIIINRGRIVWSYDNYCACAFVYDAQLSRLCDPQSTRAKIKELNDVGRI